MSASEPPAPAGYELPTGAVAAAGGVPTAKSRSRLWKELKSMFWGLMIVIPVWTFIGMNFYIPSESMMPTLLKGDRLVVSKFPYGWSWVSPSFNLVPHMQGRVFGQMPERGDVVVVRPPGSQYDYIKRVIGLPGDTIELAGGILTINGKPVKREMRPPTMIPLDRNLNCGRSDAASSGDRRMSQFIATYPGDRQYCSLPVVRETLPNGRSYDTIDLGPGSGVDDYSVIVPADHVFLLGDNRDASADSRVQLSKGGLGGPVPWENIGGRAEFITVSFDGSSSYWNPISWFGGLRSGRSGASLHPQDNIE